MVDLAKNLGYIMCYGRTKTFASCSLGFLRILEVVISLLQNYHNSFNVFPRSQWQEAGLLIFSNISEKSFRIRKKKEAFVRDMCTSDLIYEHLCSQFPFHHNRLSRKYSFTLLMEALPTCLELRLSCMVLTSQCPI